MQLFAVQAGDLNQLKFLLKRVNSRSLGTQPNILQGLLRLVLFATLTDERHMQLLIDFYTPVLDFHRFLHFF